MEEIEPFSIASISSALKKTALPTRTGLRWPDRHHARIVRGLRLKIVQTSSTEYSRGRDGLLVTLLVCGTPSWAIPPFSVLAEWFCSKVLEFVERWAELSFIVSSLLKITSRQRAVAISGIIQQCAEHNYFIKATIF